jgi:fumarylpyruvate hydrolase
MSEFLFEVAKPAVAVSGMDRLFPVHRIYCVGKNYAAHSKEMGGNPDREAPVFFMKAPDTVVMSGASIDYPPGTNDLHHEIELVVAIGSGGEDIDESAAANHIFGYAVGIDLTRRDLQGLAKGQGGPWDTAKSFECSAPITAIRTVEEVGHPTSGRIWLSVNGELRQEGNLDELIWSIPETIAGLSRLFTLAPGDLIFTGTPAGVGSVVRGDQISGGVDGVDEISIRIEYRH